MKRLTINHEIAVERREVDGKIVHVALVLAGYSERQTVKAIERARERLKEYPHNIHKIEICLRPSIAKALEAAALKRKRRAERANRQ